MDLTPLSEMTYSGRGITLGKLPDDRQFVAYTLTGRSASSQARRLAYDQDAGIVRIEVTDEEILSRGDPRLLVYDAISHHGNVIVTSNGLQTKLLQEVASDQDYGSRDVPDLLLNAAMMRGMSRRSEDQDYIDPTTYEPDSNHTPRISGAVRTGGIPAFYWVFRNSDSSANRNLEHCQVSAGQAGLLTTYDGGNEKPKLKPFQGMPRRVAISTASVDELADAFFQAIEGGEKPGENFQVAAAVMALDKDNNIEVAVRNRF